MKNTNYLSIQQLVRRITPDKIGYVLAVRPRRIGVLAFATFLEYRHFPPLPDNPDFQMALIDWEDMGFGIVVIPQDKEPLAAAILKELGLRKADGVPTMIDSRGTHHFPIQLPNVFNVENITGHFAFKNDPSLNKTAFDFENEVVEREQVAMMERWKETLRAKASAR